MYTHCNSWTGVGSKNLGDRRKMIAFYKTILVMKTKEIIQVFIIGISCILWSNCTLCGRLRLQNSFIDNDWGKWYAYPFFFPPLFACDSQSIRALAFLCFFQDMNFKGGSLCIHSDRLVYCIRRQCLQSPNYSFI